MADDHIRAVVRVFGAPPLLAGSFESFSREIAVAVAAVGDSKLTPADILVFQISCDGHAGPVSVDYQHHTGTHREVLLHIAASIGCIVKRHFGDRWIQVIAWDLQRCPEFGTWVSPQYVEKQTCCLLLAELQKLLPGFETKARLECYCEANHSDNKGPCNHHRQLSICSGLIAEANGFLTVDDFGTVQSKADAWYQSASTFVMK